MAYDRIKLKIREVPTFFLKNIILFFRESVEVKFLTPRRISFPFDDVEHFSKPIFYLNSISFAEFCSVEV